MANSDWVYKNTYNGGNCNLLVFSRDDELTIEVEDYHGVALHGLTRDEAIAAARAILKHFNCWSDTDLKG